MEQIKELDPIGIASIHATILAILLGVFCAYYLYVLSALEHLQTQAFETAYKVNGLEYGWYYSDYPDSFAEKNRKDMNALLRRLSKVVRGDPNEGVPQGLVSRVEEAMAIISALSYCYPFPFYEPPGSERRYPNPPHPQKLSFKSPEELRRWANEVEELNSRIHPLLRQTLLEMINACGVYYTSKYPGPPPPSATPEQLADVKARNEEMLRSYRSMAEAFLRNVAAAYELAKSAVSRLDEAEAMRSRYPGKALALVVLSAGFLLFLSGVAVPLVTRHVFSFWSVWLPAFLYVIAFLTSLIYVATR